MPTMLLQLFIALIWEELADFSDNDEISNDSLESDGMESGTLPWRSFPISQQKTSAGELPAEAAVVLARIILFSGS